MVGAEVFEDGGVKSNWLFASVDPGGMIVTVARSVCTVR
jgi:hypothetical protein